MDNLPPELILNIASYLNFRDLLGLSLVSRKFWCLTNQHVILKRIKLYVTKDLLWDKDLLWANFTRNYLCVKLNVTKLVFKHEIPKRIREHLFESVEYLELVFAEEDFFSRSTYVHNFIKLLKEMKNLKFLKWESIENIAAPYLEDYVDWHIGCNYQELQLCQMNYLNFKQFFQRFFQNATNLKRLTVECDCKLEQIEWKIHLTNFLISQKILRHLCLRYLRLDDTFFKELENLQLSHFTLEYGRLKQHEYFCKFLEQQNLQYLRISETKGLNDVIIRNICNLRNLKHLEISICNGFEMTTSAIPQLYNLQKLEVLRISNHPLLEKGSNFFSRITNPGNVNQNMKDLKLQYITLNSLQEMTENFPNLSELELKEANLTDLDLKIIFQNLKNLYKLNLDVSSPGITNDCIISSALHNLRHLNLINGHNLLKEEFVTTILRNTPDVCNLHFEFCINLSNEWMQIATDQLKNLKLMKLSGFGGVQSHPKLDIGFIEIVRGSNWELKLNFFLHSKFADHFNIMEDFKIGCE